MRKKVVPGGGEDEKSACLHEDFGKKRRLPGQKGWPRTRSKGKAKKKVGELVGQEAVFCTKEGPTEKGPARTFLTKARRSAGRGGPRV